MRLKRRVEELEKWNAELEAKIFRLAATLYGTLQALEDDLAQEPYKVEGCTCRLVTTIGGRGYYAGIDDCPVHGFSDNEDGQEELDEQRQD